MMNASDWLYDKLKLDKHAWAELLQDNSIFYSCDLEMLLYVFDCPNHRTSATELSNYFGVHHNKITGSNRSLAHRILKKANTETQNNSSGGKRYWNIVYTNDGRDGKDGKDNNGHFIWEIRPALVKAIEEVFDKKPDLLLKAIPQNELFEGKRQNKNLTVYERNALARQRCIGFYGLRCTICGFDFEEAYGIVGKNKIIVHHLTQLRDKGGVNGPVSPEKDLRPVCPNCHLIIHSKYPAYTIEEVRGFLKNDGNP